MPEPPTDGERWAHAELARLRDARWTPPALLGFLAASQRRATVTRRRRAQDARRAATWMLFGAAAWVIAASCDPTGPWRRAGARALAWWTGCALMLDWHLGMLETTDGRPVALGGADGLTLVRAWLVPAVAQDAAPALVIIGAVSDLADGFVARRTRTTRLGRDLEGLVDACFTTAALYHSVRAGRISRLPAGLELARLSTGAGYACANYFVAGHAPDRALNRSGRRAVPIRTAALAAAGYGHRRLADRLLFAGTALALAGWLHRASTGQGSR